MTYTMGSLFAGIGGFDLGFERAGFKTVWQVEIDPYCQKVLAKNFPEAERFGDIRLCGIHNLRPVDIICGGFPCQDISYAGYGAGLAGERSGLFYELARIVRELGPRIVVLENVAALLGRGIEHVLGTLSDLGFDAEWSIVSACSVGATHMRERVFIVAHANSLNGRQRLWDTNARPFGAIQAVGGFEGASARARKRVENPSELYRGANGISAGLDRNRGIGNSVYPDVAEAIARRIRESLEVAA
jgi:DNA (cytosine-5)-methyltransferase 1